MLPSIAEIHLHANPRSERNDAVTKPGFRAIVDFKGTETVIFMAINGFLASLYLAT